MSYLLWSVIWFSILYFGFFFSSKNKDFFGPIKLFCILNILRNLLYLILLYFDESIFLDTILYAIQLSLDDAIYKYSIIQTIAFLSILIGISLVRTKNKGKIFTHYSKDYPVLKKTSNILFLIGFFSYLSFLIQVGGIGFLIANLSNRVEIQSGSFVKIFMPLMSIATIMRVKIYSQNKSKLNKILLYLFLVISILANSSLGGRKTTVFLIIMTIVAFHYFIKPFTFKTIKSAKVFLITFLLGFYTFFIPILRSPDGYNKLINGEVNLSEELDFNNIVSYFSYTYIDIFCANYFNENNKWNFSTLMTLPLNFDLSKDTKQRPPIDEGVYFYNIARYNKYYKPPTAKGKMHIISLPIENFGFGYANYLIPGIILSSLFLGMIYKLGYNSFLRSKSNPIILFLYLEILFNFNFSSLRIMNLVFLTVNLAIAYFIYKYLLNFSKK